MKSRALIVVGVVLIALGVAFATLPKEWIEDTIGFEPDGGNGTLELLVALAPIVLGTLLLALAYLRLPGRRRAVDIAGDDAG